MVICLWWHEGCHLKSVKFCADAFGLQTRLIPSIFRKKSCHTHLDALDVQNWFKDYDWVSKPGLSDASFVASHAFLQFHSFKIDTIGYNWFHFFFAFSLHRTRAVEAFRLKPLKPLKPRFHFSFSFIEDGLSPLRIGNSRNLRRRPEWWHWGRAVPAHLCADPWWTVTCCIIRKVF